MSFWKIVRWGGTALVIAMLALAAVSSQSGQGQHSSGPRSGEAGLRLR